MDGNPVSQDEDARDGNGNNNIRLSGRTEITVADVLADVMESHADDNGSEWGSMGIAPERKSGAHRGAGSITERASNRGSLESFAESVVSAASGSGSGRRGSIMAVTLGDEPDSVWAKGEDAKPTFVDAAAMKEKVRQNLLKPRYSVMDYYHENGCSQAIAKSPFFDKLTMLIIAANAVWIALETDLNPSELLIRSPPEFILIENLFCLFFTFEWLVRYRSFRHKLDGLRDAWFVFDTFMVTMMVLETWIFSAVLLMFMGGSGGEGGGANSGVMRLARLLRLSRMCRMGKLLRVMPELLIMLKGMKAATRSVFFTLLLLAIIIYIFAIAFVQLADGSSLQEQYFPSVPRAAYTLLIYGIFLDNIIIVAEPLISYPHLFIVFFSFVLIGALTVMNMLVGVLCEVVSAVAATEQEEMLVSYVHEKLSRVMAMLDEDGGGTISKNEFHGILDNAEAVRCLNDVGVDIFALIDLTDYIFEETNLDGSTHEVELDFARFMEIVLQLRGTNQATVKDILDLRKFIRTTMQECETAIMTRLEEKSLSRQTSKAVGDHGLSKRTTCEFFSPFDSSPVPRITEDATLRGTWEAVEKSLPMADPADAEEHQLGSSSPRNGSASPRPSHQLTQQLTRGLSSVSPREGRHVYLQVDEGHEDLPRRKDKMHSNGGPSQNGHSRDIDETLLHASTTTFTQVLRGGMIGLDMQPEVHHQRSPGIPRVHIAPRGGDVDEHVRLYIDNICGQLELAINDALALAGRYVSDKRHYNSDDHNPYDQVTQASDNYHGYEGLNGSSSKRSNQEREALNGTPWNSRHRQEAEDGHSPRYAPTQRYIPPPVGSGPSSVPVPLQPYRQPQWC